MFIIVIFNLTLFITLRVKRISFIFFIIKEDILKKESIIQCVENSRKDAARRATEIDR